MQKTLIFTVIFLSTIVNYGKYEQDEQYKLRLIKNISCIDRNTPLMQKIKEFELLRCGYRKDFVYEGDCVSFCVSMIR